jgi:hypothetical protein
VQATTLTRATRVLIVGAGLVFLLAVVAAATHAGFGHKGGNGVASHTLVSYAVTSFLILIVVLLPVAIYFKVMEIKEQPTPLSGKRRTVRGLVGIAAAMVFAYFFHKVWPHIHPLRATPPHIKLPPQAGKGHSKLGHAAKPAGPTFEWPALWVALAFLFAASSFAVYRLRKRQPLSELAALGLEEDVAATIGDAIDDLEREPDARKAVIAAYARMEAVLGRHGLQRRLSETPIEYLRRVLSDVTTHGEAVSRLTALFEHAKFSTHEIGMAEKQGAIQSLREIREGIT